MQAITETTTHLTRRGSARRIHDWIDGLARSPRKTATIAAMATALFATLAVTAATNTAALLPFDQAVQAWIMGIREPWLNRFMIAFTFLGTRWVIVGLALILAGWSWKTGRQRMLVTFIIVAMAVNPLIEHTLKEIVGRPRPDLDRLLRGRGPSFPSGHVLASTAFYGMLPLLVWKSSTKVWTRLLAASGAVVMSVGMAFSRVYLDVHWSVDATAGFILGTVMVIVTGRLHHWAEHRKGQVERGAERGRTTELSAQHRPATATAR
jgi:undecaprenyl-diphosphatase